MESLRERNERLSGSILPAYELACDFIDTILSECPACYSVVTWNDCKENTKNA